MYPDVEGPPFKDKC